MRMTLATTAAGMEGQPSAAPAETDLVQACQDIVIAQQNAAERSTIPDSSSWLSYAAEVEDLQEAIAGIVRQPARTQRELWAKAIALHSLLQHGESNELHHDASVPERLAWSLVQDLLALLPSISP